MPKPFDPHEAWLEIEYQREQARLKSHREGTAPQRPSPDFEIQNPFSNKKGSSQSSYEDSLQRAFDHLLGPQRPPPQPTAPTTSPAPTPGVTWDDVVGQVEAKAAVREAIEAATKHAEIYRRYGRRPTRGLCLYGPPGNGKTMLGRAAANALATQHGAANEDSAFIYVKGPEVLNMYVGASEQKIRDLFARAHRHMAARGYPAVIFVDEAEAILGHRSEHSMSSTTVPAFLAEMDGLTTNTSALVVIATNIPSRIDSAVLREGRIDRKILVGRPSREDAVALLERGLRCRPVEGTPDDLAAVAARALYEPGRLLYRLRLSDGSTRDVTLGDFTSGARLAFLVDAAASFAIEREIATGQVGHIEERDFVAAIDRLLREQRSIDHPSDLVSFCDGFLNLVVGVERVLADGSMQPRRSLITEIPKGVDVQFMNAGGSS